jgi:biotin transporter BioY
MWTSLIVGWLAVAVLGWSWLAAAARADRADRAHARRRRPRRR